MYGKNWEKICEWLGSGVWGPASSKAGVGLRVLRGWGRPTDDRCGGARVVCILHIVKRTYGAGDEKRNNVAEKVRCAASPALILPQLQGNVDHRQMEVDDDY